MQSEKLLSAQIGSNKDPIYGFAMMALGSKSPGKLALKLWLYVFVMRVPLHAQPQFRDSASDWQTEMLREKI